MDRVSRHSQGVEGVHFGGLKIVSFFVADDMVLLASLCCDLQHVLREFA